MVITSLPVYYFIIIMAMSCGAVEGKGSRKTRKHFMSVMAHGRRGGP